MALLTVTIRPHSRKVRVEMDAGQFERLAASFGLFNPEFLESLKRAEKDYRTGKTKKITSLSSITPHREIRAEG